MYVCVGERERERETEREREIITSLGYFNANFLKTDKASLEYDLCNINPCATES